MGSEGGKSVCVWVCCAFMFCECATECLFPDLSLCGCDCVCPYSYTIYTVCVTLRACAVGQMADLERREELGTDVFQVKKYSAKPLCYHTVDPQLNKQVFIANHAA